MIAATPTTPADIEAADAAAHAQVTALSNTGYAKPRAVVQPSFTRTSPTQRKPGDNPYAKSPIHARPNPFTAAVASAQKAADVAEYGAMPVYADDPAVWVHRMHSRMTGLLRARNIKNTEAIQGLLNAVDTRAASTDHVGDERYYLGTLNRLLRERRRQQADDDRRSKEIRRLTGKACGAGLLEIEYGGILQDFITSRSKPNYAEAEARIDRLIAQKGQTMSNQPMTDAPARDRVNAVTARRQANDAERERAHAATDARDATPKAPSEFDTFDQHAEWVDNDTERKAFFGNWSNVYGKYVAKHGAPAGKHDEFRKAHLKHRTGVDSLKTWKGSADELLMELETELMKTYCAGKLYWRIKGEREGVGDIKLTVKADFETEAIAKAKDLRGDFRVLATLAWVDDGSCPIREITPGEYALEYPVAGNAPNGAPAASEAPTGGNVPGEDERTPSGPVVSVDKPISQESVNVSEQPIIDKAQFRKERMINVSGQKYLKAGDRVVMFRADHPDWALETETVAIAPDFAVFKAYVRDSAGKVLSTGHGYCTPDLAKKVSGRFVEKAETAAISRALALAGYGSDDTLDDSDYLSDSPVTKAA